MSVRAILLLAVLIPSLPVCFVRPFYGVIVWTIIAFLNPQDYTFQAKSFPWAMAVAIPTIAGSFIFGRGWGRVFTRESLPIVVLWIWFAFTTIVSLNNPLFADHAFEVGYKLSFVSKILLMTFVTIAVVDSFERLRILVMVIGGCFAFFVVKAFPFLLMGGAKEGKIYGPPASMIADNNDFGLALNMTLPIFFFLAQTETHPKLKRALWAVFFMTIPSILFTFSRGALVGLVAILGLMILRLKQRVLLIPVAIFGIGLTVFLAPQSWKERMNLSRDGAVLDASAMSRINAWTFSWNLATDYPLTGGGFDTFTRDLFDRYAPNTRDLHGPHSVYFGVLAEHGFPGFFLYLCLVVSCFVNLREVLKWGRYYGDEAAVNYANMFSFSLFAFLTSGLFLGRAYFDYYFTIVACIIVLKKACLQKWTFQVSDEEESGEEDEEAEAGLPGFISQPVP
jgi:probable O-glycosylation ligase (exosortase A-associated)